MFFEVGKRLVEIQVQFLLAHAAHHAAAGAVTAVGGATIRHEKKRAVRISVNQAGHRHGGILSAGIGEIVRGIVALPDFRNDLSADRTGGIGAVNEVEVVWGDRKGKLRAGENDARPLIRGQEQVFVQGGKCGDPVLELPFPILPLCGGGIRPVTGGMGNEAFPAS